MWFSAINVGLEFLEAIEKEEPLLIEEKIDGWGMLWNGEDLISKNGVCRTSRFPHIAKVLKKVFGNTHVRGEVAIPGGRLYSIARRENWDKASFFPFWLPNADNIFTSRAELENICSKVRGNTIILPRKFSSVKSAWNVIEKEKGEGIVAKTQSGAIYKVKRLEELKCEILEYDEKGGKGSFTICLPSGIIANVSATSAKYVEAYHILKERGCRPYVEIEFMYMSDSGKPIQPRIRRLGTLEMLKE